MKSRGGPRGGVEMSSSESEGFDRFYESQDRGGALKSIFRKALGMESLPEEIVPYSFVTLDDLRRIGSLLHLGEGRALADLACGNGSLGLWLASVTGAALTGIDFSGAAVALAGQKARILGLDSRCTFRVGSFEATGLDSGTFDAAVSIDAIWLSPDQSRALSEAARVLKSGARFVFTTWEQRIPMPFVKQPVADYRPLLEAASFEIEVYDYLLHSELVMNEIYFGIRESRQRLVEEMGESVSGLIGEAHFVPGLVDGVNYISAENGPHILISAVKR